MEIPYNRDTEGTPPQNLFDWKNAVYDEYSPFIHWHCHPLKIFFESVATLKQMLVFLKSYQLPYSSFGSKGPICIT